MTRFSDFDRMVAQFMKEFGFVATYKKVTGAVPNDETGSVDVTTKTVKIQAIKMELLRPSQGSDTTKFGTNISNGEQNLFVRPAEKTDSWLDPLDVNPESDKIVINGEEWSIFVAKKYDPSNEDCILHELYIRK